MNSIRTTKALLVLTLCGGSAIPVSSQTLSKNDNQTCVVQVSGVQFKCPAGWSIVKRSEMFGTITIIGDFVQTDSENNLRIAAGHTTISLQGKWEMHRDLKEWIASIARDPQNIQSTKTLPNKIVGQVKMTVFAGDIPRSDWASAAYYFEFNGTPLCLGITYQRTSKKAAEYLATLDSIVANLEPVGVKAKP